MADSEKGTPKQYRWRNGNQYLAVIAANVICLGHGCLIGWMSPSLPVLLSEETPLKTGPLSNEQLSWIASINSIGAISGTFTTGLLIIFFGCKRAMLFLSLPSILFWVLIYIGDTYYHVLIARIFTGFTGAGIQTTLILYSSEIANDKIRGKLASFTPLARNFGILIAYIVCAAVNYTTVPCVFVFVPVLFIICFSYLRNTPQFHLLRGESQQAKDSLEFYKGCNGNDPDDMFALEKELERLKFINNVQTSDESIGLKDIFNRAAIRGIIIGVILSFLTQLCGASTFVTYAAVIFKSVGGSNIDPFIGSITIAVVQILGSLFTTQLSDRLGRKFLVLVSLFGSSIGLILFAFYLYLNDNGYDLSSFEWVPVTCLSFVIFIASAGIIPLALVCTVENLPSKIRTIGLTISTLGFNIASFTCLKSFPFLIEKIGLHGCLMIFAIACILGAVFVLVTMEETKGRSLEQADAKVAKVYRKSYAGLPITFNPNVERNCPEKY